MSDELDCVSDEIELHVNAKKLSFHINASAL